MANWRPEGSKIETVGRHRQCDFFFGGGGQQALSYQLGCLGAYSLGRVDELSEQLKLSVDTLRR